MKYTPQGHDMESDIQRNILSYLATRGIVAWRTNAGYIKRNVKLAPSGTPDIIGYLPNGRLLGIEVKRPKGKVSDSQQAWLDRAEQAGCAVMVARSVEEVVRQMEAWCIS